MTKTQAKQLVVCVENDGYAVSLEKRKIYIALRDAAAEKHNMLRIIDESGEDYLYPKAFFRSIALPLAVKRAVLAALGRLTATPCFRFECQTAKWIPDTSSLSRGAMCPSFARTFAQK